MYSLDTRVKILRDQQFLKYIKPACQVLTTMAQSNSNKEVQHYQEGAKYKKNIYFCNINKHTTAAELGSDCNKIMMQQDSYSLLPSILI